MIGVKENFILYENFLLNYDIHFNREFGSNNRDVAFFYTGFNKLLKIFLIYVSKTKDTNILLFILQFITAQCLLLSASQEAGSFSFLDGSSASLYCE